LSSISKPQSSLVYLRIDMTVTPINSLSEFQDLIGSGDVVVIDFWATWCGPCRVISPVFEQLSNNERFSSIKFCKVDVDDQPDISQEVGVRAMPTFVAFKNGEKLKDLVGAVPQGLQDLLNAVVSA